MLNVIFLIKMFFKCLKVTLFEKKNKLLLPDILVNIASIPLKLSFMFSSNKDIHFKTGLQRKYRKNCVTRI